MPDLSEQSYIAPPTHPAVQAITQPTTSTLSNGHVQANGVVPNGAAHDPAATHPRDHAYEQASGSPPTNKPLPPKPALSAHPTENTDHPSTAPTEPSSTSTEPTIIDTTHPPPSAAAAEGIQSSRQDDAYPASNPKARQVLNGTVVGEENTGDKGLIDVGWDRPTSGQLVSRLDNEDLWALIRRFNKQLYHVKATDGPLPGGLDLWPAEEEEFAPDKLRSNFERVYVTVVTGMAAFVKHVARLRSWNERNRTIAWLAGYYIAWALNVLFPTILTLLFTLIMFPQSRPLLFPPAPLAAVSASSGTLQQPRSGQLDSKDSLTGAPETYKGEAVEHEASNLITGLAGLAAGTAIGKAPEESRADRKAAKGIAVPDVGDVIAGAGDAKEVASGKKPREGHDKTKEPVNQAVWEKARPVMRGVAGVADVWEMFGNALSPTPPFGIAVRLRLAGIIAPLILVSLVLDERLVYQGTTFILGFVFFGQPVLVRGIEWLERKVPNWQWYLEPRNTILKGAPTNAQLTLTLLRIGEAHKAPLPPPPSRGVQEAPPSRPTTPLAAEDMPMEVSQAELDSIQHPDPVQQAEAEAADQKEQEAKPKKQHRFLNFVKATARTGVSTVLGADQVRAKAIGDQHAKRRLGVLHHEKEAYKGPTTFNARYDGKKGRIVISTQATSPCVAFVPGTDSDMILDALWTVGISEIRELKKVGGLGAKGRLVVGYALGMEIVDGLEIVGADGKGRLCTAIEKREELFNRLVAMDGQKWESW
ncbi:hypothetical protein OE88DRAFT_1632450 [Heliocybe sulcata]|uniref:Uncharacterized protein n=1 Tax=Heliocybe sulcata TaxID=5364 RepID=A0A5C3MXV2_9AGAM|nr:hypothetical protein OE88DRAFT_1632450 [Heliocybe sulcata]